MIQSMTGFGRVEESIDHKKITIEIKSLNSKSLDLSLKMPHKFKEKELEVKRLITAKLMRGKVDFYFSLDLLKEASDKKINLLQVATYIQELEKILPNQTPIEYLKLAMRLPDIIHTPEKKEEEEDNWNLFFAAINKSVDALILYRETEGAILENELTGRIKQILHLLKEVNRYEVERIITVKERLKNNLVKLATTIDENRFEQELIYYLEKLDVTEEKLRLESNCNYFLDEINSDSAEVGKKLGFISQEIGREINTLGSKANHIEMQKLVVNMKDELEKVKEQLLNVL